MINYVVTFFYLLILGMGTSQVISAQFNTNLAAKLQETLDTQLASFPDTKGVSASVYYPGQGVWKGASGLSHAGVPITTDMEFGIASNSKLFTSVAVMKLVQSNKLNLNDPLHKWLPKFTNVDSTITLRQLLNHTSGINDIFTTAAQAYIEANPSHVFTTAEVMAYVGTKLFNPGTSYGYSNTNYILAGLIIESATGQSYAKIIRDSILTPLQLDSTFISSYETVLGTIAHPWHDAVDRNAISRTALNTLVTSAGTMYSTSGEMAKWYQALFSGNVVDANSLREITTFVSSGNYGFGLLSMQLFGRTLWSHGGSTIGYKSRMFYDPAMKATVCGLSNSNQSAIDGAITATLLKVLIDYLPAAAQTITGANTVCQGQKSVIYSTATIANATSYTWTLPEGGILTSATNSITVDFPPTASSGTITVVGTNMYGNGTPATINVTVHPLPIVSFKPVIPRAICQSAAPILLTDGTPIGGMYTGKGVQNGVFDPTVASVGDWVITYTFSNSNGCTSSDSILLKVVPLPSVTFKESKTKLCIQSTPISLTGGLPSGGVYSGKGVENGIFNPTIAGLGTHILSYFYADTNGCARSDSTAISVVPLPTVQYASPVKNYCTNTPPVTLTGGTPTGGLYSGIGVKNGVFDPAISGEGEFTVLYDYTDGNGCSGVDSARMNVHSISSISLNKSVVDSFILNGVTYTKSGSYTQVLQNVNGCDSTITLALTITTTSVEEEGISPKAIVLVPNPSAHGTFSIRIPKQDVSPLPDIFEMYNALGVKVFSASLADAPANITTHLPSGIYLYRLLSRNTLIFAGNVVVL
ncbi:MAG: serine hydrolase [Ignavibacteria bacterium]|nr:serine hydrolase [Ignavibacteria bacterium]